MYFEHNGVIYPNNSVIPLSHIGTDTSALRCYTNKQGCCGTFGMRYGEFYYPNGTTDPIEGAKYDMYRNRGDQFIRLNRRIVASDAPPLQESIDVKYQMNGENVKPLYHSEMKAIGIKLQPAI